MDILTVALGTLLIISPVKGDSGAGGYRGITRHGDGFVAAGSDGRIDRITMSGEVIRSDRFTGESFNCIFSDGKMVIAGGDGGTIVVSPDGTSFRKAESVTGNDINSVVVFNSMIMAGADRGEIITGNAEGSFRRILPGVRGNIVSVSAGASGCYGVTDEGEIIHSADGTAWEVFDFNKAYSGFYKPGCFTRVVVTDDLITVAGVRNDGSPMLVSSSQGKVWTDRILNYTDDMELQGSLRDKPNDILYDSDTNQYFIACSGGKLMRLSSCHHCNRLTVLTGEDLTAISSAGNTLVVVGSNFFVRILDLNQLAS